MAIDLPLIFAAIIGFAVFMYVLMDGFSLGVGILFLWAPSDDDRNVMMNSTAPIWDGNQTWLVLGGGGLMAGFPLAYAILLPALYLPLMVMLIALIFRGVSFEFRFKAGRYRFLWDYAFTGGSIVAALAQGVALGAFIKGIEVEGRSYAGGAFDWLSPFSLMIGLAVVAGYALLGATWLILKTEGALQDRAREISLRLLVAVLFFMAAVSLVTPLHSPDVARRWFSWPNTLYLSPVPLAVAVVTAALYRALRRRRELAPFVLVLALFTLGYAGLAISVWPNLVPPGISIWQAAAAPNSQAFLLVGVVVLIPLILGYTAYTYWVFRGKVRRDVGYA